MARRDWKPQEGASDFPGKFLLRVDDTLKALGDLAHVWRRRHSRVKVVAITGSNGKTTAKEMTARTLSGPFRILKTEGNLNNLIGLPLMLLKLSSDHEVAVLEMGMNRAGGNPEAEGNRRTPGFPDHQHRPGPPGIPGQSGRDRPGQGGTLGGAESG